VLPGKETSPALLLLTLPYSVLHRYVSCADTNICTTVWQIVSGT